MSEITIALDAGHGGSDSGAVYKSRKEKDDTLRLTRAGALSDKFLKTAVSMSTMYAKMMSMKPHLKRQPMPIMPVRITLYPFTAIPQSARTSTTVWKHLYTTIPASKPCLRAISMRNLKRQALKISV